MRSKAFALLAAAILIAACSKPVQQEKLLHIGDFDLIDHDGRPFRKATLQGHPSLLFFGYTHCPDACPTMMAKVARAYRAAGPAAERIPTYFVSVDPRDTPPVLREYVTYFRSVPARGVTGPKPQIDSIVKQFGAVYQIHETGSAAGALVDHTVRLYLLDEDGDVIRLFDPSTDPAEIASALRTAAG